MRVFLEKLGATSEWLDTRSLEQFSAWVFASEDLVGNEFTGNCPGRDTPGIETDSDEQIRCIPAGRAYKRQAIHRLVVFVRPAARELASSKPVLMNIPSGARSASMVAVMTE